MPEVEGDGLSVGTLRAADGGSSRDYVAFAIQERAADPNPNNGPQSKGYQEGVAYTLEARSRVQSVAASAVRRLTPVECERLQGFADDYTLIPWRGRPAAECPDGPRYKALGNSMAVPVMRWIGERIALVDAIAAEPLNSSRQAHEGRAEGEIRMNPESSERNAA
jgi:DNA (cytosine-5)-methyltransferase 1